MPYRRRHVRARCPAILLRVSPVRRTRRKRASVCRDTAGRRNKMPSDRLSMVCLQSDRSPAPRSTCLAPALAPGGGRNLARRPRRTTGTIIENESAEIAGRFASTAAGIVCYISFPINPCFSRFEIYRDATCSKSQLNVDIPKAGFANVKNLRLRRNGAATVICPVPPQQQTGNHVARRRHRNWGSSPSGP